MSTAKEMALEQNNDGRGELQLRCSILARKTKLIEDSSRVLSANVHPHDHACSPHTIS